jgi:transglutaminase-like putative cysteine protease
MRYHIRHATHYSYGTDVVHSHQLLHLVPRPAPYQLCLEHALAIAPGTYRRHDDVDAFGNPVSRIEIEHPHRALEITTEMEIEVHARPALPVAESAPWERVAARLAYGRDWPGREDLEASRFRHESAYVRVKRAFTEYGEECFPRDRPILACAEALMEKMHAEFRYAPGETSIATPLTEVLAGRSGVCQDFAHIMIACLRSRGLAARYVSGYVRMLEARDAAERGAPADSTASPRGAAASHAWVAVYSPPFGWVELDPTNNARVSTDHIAVAWGRDFGDVSPLRGVILGGGTHALSVDVSVTLIPSSPRH